MSRSDGSDHAVIDLTASPPYASQVDHDRQIAERLAREWHETDTAGGTAPPGDVVYLGHRQSPPAPVRRRNDAHLDLDHALAMQLEREECTIVLL
jgi:hypothetical protein